MHEDVLEAVFINFSQRSVEIVDDEGNKKTIRWRWDKEGAEGFSETVSELRISSIHTDIIAYTFAEAEVWLDLLVLRCVKQKITLILLWI